MRTGASDVSSRGFRGQVRPDARLKRTRKTRLRRAFLESEFLESRTLLATIPAATATGTPAMNLSGLGSVTQNGNANSPMVVVDPYDSQKLFAVWGVDLSTLSPVPHTTAVVEGAYSTNGGTNWTSLSAWVAFPQFDVATVNANPSSDYTQVTDPSVAFDSQGNVLRARLADQRRQPRRAGPDQVQIFRHTDAEHGLHQQRRLQWVTGWRPGGRPRPWPSIPARTQVRSAALPRACPSTPPQTTST